MSGDEPDPPEAWVNFGAALDTDDKTAVREHLRIFAETGVPVTSAFIAAMYEDGHDQIRASRALAFYWYGQGAYEENDKYGYFGLARCYFSGIHVPEDREAAIARLLGQYLAAARYWIRSIQEGGKLLDDSDDHRLYLLNDAVKKAMSVKTNGH